jgi:hypothetical protein
MGSFAGSLTHQQTYLKSVAALGKFAIPPGEVSELSGPVATEKYFDPSKMILAECQRVNLATLTGVERARYWHRTLGGVNMKRLQAMSAQGKVDGLHQISNPHEDFAATTEGKWRRDPIVRSKINNKLQMKEAPYSRLFCDGKYGFSTKSVGGRVLTYFCLRRHEEYYRGVVQDQRWISNLVRGGIDLHREQGISGQANQFWFCCW